MSIRRMLPVMVAALALLAASAAFAADTQPVPLSKDEFLSSLKAPADGEALPDFGVPEPHQTHADGPCTYLGVQCKSCTTGGYKACDVYRCPYGGSTHLHSYCDSFCSNPCAI